MATAGWQSLGPLYSICLARKYLLYAVSGLSCCKFGGELSTMAAPLPETWSEDLKDENGNPMSKRYTR
jgi:hypothetical protein